MADNGAPDGHALTLTAGKRARQAIEQFGEMQLICGRLNGRRHFCLGPFCHFQRIGKIGAHRHIGIERVRLEHHGDTAFGGGLVRHVLLINQQLAAADLLQTGNHAQQRRFPAA